MVQPPPKQARSSNVLELIRLTVAVALAVGGLIGLVLFWFVGWKAAAGMACGIALGAAHLLSWVRVSNLILGERLSRWMAIKKGSLAVIMKLAVVYVPGGLLLWYWPTTVLPMLGGFALVLFSVVPASVLQSRAAAVLIVAVGVTLTPQVVQASAPESTNLWVSLNASVKAAATQPEKKDPSADKKNEKKKKKEKPRSSGHLPTLGGLLYKLMPNNPVAKFLHNHAVERVMNAILAAVVLSLLLGLVARRAALKPGRLQVAVEAVVTWLYDLVRSVIPDKEARVFLPFLGSLFLYILLTNLMGVVPLTNPGTSFITMTAALAVATFLTVQYAAFSRLGLGGVLYHWAGEPKGAVGWVIAILLFPLHIVEEFIRPTSLALRLYGNIFGEHTLTAVMTALGVMALASLNLPVGIPLELPFMFLGLLTGTIQALVFLMLSMIYISLVMPHEEHAEH